MWALCEAIGKDIDNIAGKLDYSHGEEHDIILTIDGVELNFQNFIDRLIEVYNASVDTAAERLLIERCDKIMDMLSSVKEELKEQCTTLFPNSNYKDDWK